MANVYLDYDLTYEGVQYEGSCYCGVTLAAEEGSELSCAPYLFFAIQHSGLPFPNMFELIGKTQQELADRGIWFNNAAVRLEDAQ